MSDHDLSHLTHLSFEDAYAQLEKLVEQLETNSLPLEESLSLFEEGQQLSSYCQQLLDKADLRVSKLAGIAGDIVAMNENDGETKAVNKPDETAETPVSGEANGNGASAPKVEPSATSEGDTAKAEDDISDTATSETDSNDIE